MTTTAPRPDPNAGLDPTGSHAEALRAINDPRATPHDRNVAEITIKRHEVTQRLRRENGAARRKRIRTKLAQSAYVEPEDEDKECECGDTE